MNNKFHDRELPRKDTFLLALVWLAVVVVVIVWLVYALGCAGETVRAESPASEWQEVETVEQSVPEAPPPPIRSAPRIQRYEPGRAPPTPSLRKFQVYVFSESYRVAPGDTLWGLAQRLGVPYEALAEENAAVLMENWLRHCLARETPPAPAGFCDSPETTLHDGLELYIPVVVLLRVVPLPPEPDINLAY